MGEEWTYDCDLCCTYFKYKMREGMYAITEDVTLHGNVCEYEMLES